ncbi:MAG TPA: biotin/lipoyl-binding protein, partial [Chloroflexi bacterium]|nr:biotin/lipoyl-binding protein [Chloroflexota bacterium]
MGKRLWVALILLLLIAAGGAGWWYLSFHPEALNQPLVELELQPAKAPEGISASGFIEAEEVSVVAELGGRIVEVLADEGDEVEEGQVLVKLDTALLEAQIAQAQA